MQIFVINGLPGVGKTTFGEIIKRKLEERGFNFLHLSSISLVKDLLLSPESSDPEMYSNDSFLYETLRKIKAEIGVRDFTPDEVFNNKTVESRRAMSLLKTAITDWDKDFLHYWVLDRAAKVPERSVIFVDIREPENIDAFKEVALQHDVRVRAVLVESDHNDEFDNPSDAAVMNYAYDLVIDNKRGGLEVDASFAKLEAECEKFVKIRVIPRNQSGLEIMSDNPEYF